jgi:hypothetical protein
MLTQSRPSVAPTSPIIDSAEVAWATAELAALVRQADPESVVGAVLKQTLRELYSLVPTADSTVIGPIRLKAAA